MTAFIKLTTAPPKCTPVKVRVGGINTYQEFDASWSPTVKTIISLSGDQMGELLYVTETPQEIDVLIRMATR